MTNTSNIVALFTANIGALVATSKGEMHINDVLTHKTGTLKSGEKVPYVHLVSEMGGEMDLHPQKARELLTKGESGAFKILSAIVSPATPNELPMFQPEHVEATPEILKAIEEFKALPSPEEALAEVKATDAKKESKKDATIRIYKAGKAAGLARKDIIAQLRAELDMGIPGASTYYQNVKSGHWV